MKKMYFATVAFFITAIAFSQGTITGTVIDGDSGDPLPGASVVVKGTNVGVATDFDGNFSIEAPESTGDLTISYIGFISKSIAFRSAGNIGQISLAPDASALDEVIVSAYSLAIDRKTPVAVSTIKAAEIETKLGSQEFPEILKATPGIYVTRGGGGFGDAQLRMRGFNSENVAVMINGIPVNDMENGRVFWSNWAGLADVTSTIQVQRGLGASKLAVPSIGGTMNTVTKSTDAVKGGNVIMSTGNNGYTKYGFTLSTGLMENGWAATIAASRTSGEGFVDGTPFLGYSYFANISKEINDKHSLSFTAFGAPQRHGQRQNRLLINDFRTSERGIQTNTDYGYKDGQLVSVEDNFYHKPKMILNHYWTISEKSKLTTSAYASFGTGGGGGWRGVNKFGKENLNYRDSAFQPLDLDLMVEENKALGALGSETILRASRNNHQWYGAISTFSTDLTDNLDFIAGVDVRWYKGEHFTEVTDLLGGQFFIDDSDDNNPNNVARVGDKIAYHDDGYTSWLGGFAQLEYSKNDLSAFVSVAASNTGYKRVDYFNYLDSDPLRETDWVNFFGYSGKGGANYNINETNNVFVNVGYFERAPFNNDVFLNFRNDINEDAVNQKIFSAELGYGIRTEKLKLDINVYRTQWNDRSESRSFTNPDGTFFSANILGINALHQGVELEATYRPSEKLVLTGMVSLGDWTWDNNVNDVQIFDEDQNPIGDPINIFIEGLKVGNAAQTTFALGANYRILPSTNIRVDYNYAGDYFGDFDPTSRTIDDGIQAWEMPAYGLFDVGLTHRFDFAGLNTSLRANIYNLFDTEYISDAQDRDGTANSALVYFGPGRTYTVGAKINF
ncbi:MAG: TonB-dependent receptor [Maribacter sp.]